MVQTINPTNEKPTTTKMTMIKSKSKTEVNYYNIQDSERKLCVFDTTTQSGGIAQEMLDFLNKNQNGNISSADMISKWTSITSTKFSKFQDKWSRWESYNSSCTLKAQYAMDNLDKAIQNFCQDNSDGGTDVTPREQGIIIQALDAFCKYLNK